MKKSQQEWVKDLMTHIILSLKGYNDGDMFSKGYSYPINGAIDNYSITYYDKKAGKNIALYQKYYKNFNEGKYKNVLMSEKAFEELNKAKKNCNPINEENKKLHGEHMTPMSYTRRILNKLLEEKDNISEGKLKEKVDFAFTHARLVIIKKEERSILDGKGKRYTSQEITDFLKNYKSYKKTITSEMENFYKDLENKPKRSYGFGAIRLFLMKQEKVNFVDFKGEKKEFEECISYLEDSNFVIECD